MSIFDLICNPATGKISHTKLWANIACAIASYKFITIPEPSFEIWACYLGIVGGYAVARRWIAGKAEEKHENFVN